MKRFLTLFIMLLTLFALISATAFAEDTEYIVGDVDGDGKVTFEDYIITRLLVSADVNSDGVLDETDHAAILAYVLDNIPLPVHVHKIVEDEGYDMTCETAGRTAGSHCSICGEVIVKSEIIPAKGHNIVIDAGKEATCTGTGLSEGAHCADCGKVIIPQRSLPAKGHIIVTDPAVAATCTKTGLTEGSHCAVCGEVIVSQKTVKAPGHISVKDPAVPATCTEPGHTEGSHCSRCGGVLTAPSVIPAIGHAYAYPTYFWNGNSCTATAICLNDSSHVYTTTVAGVFTADTAPTFYEDEKGHYTAHFTEPMFDDQNTAYGSVINYGTSLPTNDYVYAVSAGGETGDTVDIRVCFSNLPDINAFGLFFDSFAYGITPVSGVPGVGNPLINDFSSNDGLVASYSSPINVNGKYATLSFKIEDFAGPGEYDIDLYYNFECADYSTIDGYITIRIYVTGFDGHTYAPPTYTWYDNYCIAERICLDDSSLTITEAEYANYVMDTPATYDADETGHYEVYFYNSVFTFQQTGFGSVVLYGTRLVDNVYITIPSVSANSGDTVDVYVYFNNLPEATEVGLFFDSVADGLTPTEGHISVGKPFVLDFNSFYGLAAAYDESVDLNSGYAVFTFKVDDYASSGKYEVDIYYYIFTVSGGNIYGNIVFSIDVTNIEDNGNIANREGVEMNAPVGAGAYTASLNDGRAFDQQSYDNNWYGFNKNLNVDQGVDYEGASLNRGTVTFNFGKSEEFVAVRAHMWDGAGFAGVATPTAIVAYASNDGRNWNKLGSLTLGEPGEIYWAELLLDGECAQYVKVEFYFEGTWLFLNEIEIIGCGDPIPTSVQPDFLEELPEDAIAIDYAGYKHAGVVSIIAGDNQDIAELTARGNDGFSKSMNYAYNILVDKDNKVIDVAFELGTACTFVCPDGGYIITYNGNKQGYEIMADIEIGAEITLYNIYVIPIASLEGNVELVSAGFTYENPEKHSEGLEYTSNGDGTCYVSGIGTYTDIVLVIPYVSPDGDIVTSIGNGAFDGHWVLSSVTIPNSVTSIGDYAFGSCESLMFVAIPDSVTSIGIGAFYMCKSLTSVTIPDSVTSIGSEAFEYCTNLTFVAIPDSVTSIGIGAFYMCKSLTSVTIPDSVTNIGNYAFNYCYDLTDVYYYGTMAQWYDISIGDLNEYLTGATIHCTDGTIN